MSPVARLSVVHNALRSSKAREKLLRKWLGLPAKRPHTGRVRWLGKEAGNALGTMNDAQRLAEFDRWVSEARRGDLARELAYLLPHTRGRVRYAVQDLLGDLRLRLALRALRTARVLTYTSHYVHPIGATQECNGVLHAGCERTPGVGLSVLAVGRVEWLARNLWVQSSVLTDVHLRDQTYVLLTPTAILNEDIVREAILRWYMDRFEHVLGHWATRERTLPELYLRLTSMPATAGSLGEAAAARSEGEAAALQAAASDGVPIPEDMPGAMESYQYRTTQFGLLAPTGSTPGA